MTDFTLRVYWEDTDAGGIVYYANYLKFFERARTELLRAAGINQRTLSQTLGCGFIVGSANIKYLKPAYLDDQLSISVQVNKLSKASIQLHQVAKRQNQDGSWQQLATCDVMVIWADLSSLRPQKIPPSVTAALTSLLSTVLTS